MSGPSVCLNSDYLAKAGSASLDTGLTAWTLDLAGLRRVSGWAGRWSGGGKGGRGLLLCTLNILVPRVEGILTESSCHNGFRTTLFHAFVSSHTHAQART